MGHEDRPGTSNFDRIIAADPELAELGISFDEALTAHEAEQHTEAFSFLHGLRLKSPRNIAALCEVLPPELQRGKAV